MARTRIYIDIETIPSQAANARFEAARRVKAPAAMKKPETLAAWERDEKPALIEEAFLKTAFDGSVGHIVSFGYAVGNGDVHSETWVKNPDDARFPAEYAEQEGFAITNALANIDAMLDGQSHPQLVAHHAAFDIRFVTHRAIVLGIRLPSWWPRDIKPWGPDILCTMVAWAGVGNTIGLARLCNALDINPPKERDGSQVYDLWKAGAWEELDRYNRFDVSRVRDVAQRILAAHGEAEAA